MRKLKKFFDNKRVLITGHTGFKGAWLSQILLSWGAQIIGLALRPTTTPNLFSLLEIKSRIKNYTIDIRDLKKIKTIFNKEKPEIVFHLAAQPIVRDSYDDPIYIFETNTMGTANILEATREIKSVRSAIMVTTDKVYENKETDTPYKEEDKLGGYDPYGSSKAAAELIIGSYLKSFFNPDNYCKGHNTLIASARAGNVIGGGDWGKDRLMTDLVKSVFEYSKKISIRNPEAIRPWQFVLEPLVGYIILAKDLYNGHKEFSGAWNFGPRKESFISVKNLLRTAFNQLGVGSYLVNEDVSKHEAQLLKLNSEKARKNLDWRSIFDIQKTLELTLDWYKNYYDGKNVIDYTNHQIENFFKQYENAV